MHRTVLSVPMLREGTVIGVITIRRPDVEPFTDKQVELVATFADQAVIAIENVRLFKELESKNQELATSLDQQTATSDVLKLISRSAFDLQAILETLVENAVRLAAATWGHIYRFDGEVFRTAADYGAPSDVRELLAAHSAPTGARLGSWTGSSRARDDPYSGCLGRPGVRIGRGAEKAWCPQPACCPNAQRKLHYRSLRTPEDGNPTLH
jgi:GAF domain-containing protein